MQPQRTATLTADEARTFNGYSLANASLVLAAIEQRGCTCQPYEDVFTFRRWLAQGRAVRRGEHGISLPVIVERTAAEDDETGHEQSRTYRLRRTSHVFCRCQTDEARRGRIGAAS